MKRKRKVVKQIVFLVLIVIIVGTMIWKKQDNYNERMKELALDSSDSFALESILENYVDEASDIEGYTKSEKVQLGLKREDGSDSDYDGLTDKDEIEKYGSDPLKTSTAGDLYTDGYKVSNNMDLQTYYEYEGDTNIVSENVPELTFTASSALDFNVEFNDITDNLDYLYKYFPAWGLKSKEIYKVYSFKYYAGKGLSINLEPVTKGLHIPEEEIDIDIFDELETKRAISTKVSIENENATISCSKGFNIDSAYYVVIYKHQDIIQSLSSTADVVLHGKPTIDIYDNDDSYQSLICMVTLTVSWFHCRPVIYISNTASEEQINNTIAMAALMWDDCYYEAMATRPTRDEMIERLRGEVNFVDREVIKKKTILRNKFRVFCLYPERLIYENHDDGPVHTGIQDIYFYAPYDVYADYSSAQRDARREELRKFQGGDRFGFKNIVTDYYMPSHGNCAGYAWIVSLVHDNDGLDSLSGSYYSPTYDTEVSYNLDKDVEGNDTLLDRYLSDYKEDKFYTTRGFTYDEQGREVYEELPDFNNSLLTENEVEFTKMVSAYWAEYNDHKTQSEIAIKGFLNNNEKRYLSWETVENMMEALDNNRILIWGTALQNKFGMGHAMNLTGYKVWYARSGESGPEDVIAVSFDVYDSNRPLKTYELKCTRRTSLDGKSSFNYEYISDEPDLIYANFSCSDSPDNLKGLLDQFEDGDTIHLFYVFDSDLNCLNVPLE